MTETKGEPCARCSEVGEDLRTLWMGCFYDMSELGIPFDMKPMDISLKASIDLYTLRVCKRCRAEWMQSIHDWFVTKPHERENSMKGGEIYVRRFGAEVPVTKEEWDAEHGKPEGSD